MFFLFKTCTVGTNTVTMVTEEETEAIKGVHITRVRDILEMVMVSCYRTIIAYRGSGE